MADKSLYERLGGAFAIAAVINYFSDEVVKDPVAGQKSKNSDLREWHTKQLGRLPGLKFMRTLWVCSATGGPFNYVGTKPGQTVMGLENAHKDLHISPEEFDAVANVLSRSLDHFNVPAKEKGEVMAAFAAHKGEVNTGYFAAKK
jgi:hemoglobin